MRIRSARPPPTGHALVSTRTPLVWMPAADLSALADWLAACQEGGHAHKGGTLRFDTGGRASVSHRYRKFLSRFNRRDEHARVGGRGVKQRHKKYECGQLECRVETKEWTS